VYWYANKYKESMQGTTHFRQDLVRALSVAVLLPPSLALIVLPLFEPTPFFIGVALVATGALLSRYFNNRFPAVF
jgi:hypothetical protein